MFVFLTTCLIHVQALSVQDFTYSHLGQTDGLGSQRIYSILQTEDGAVWWSTKDGAERYNGVNVKHYQMGDLNMFSNFAGRITKLTKGKNAELIAFDNKGGIFSYDKHEDKFQLYMDISRSFKGDVLVNDILVTEQGLWLAMREGTFFLHDKKLVPIYKNVYTNTVIETKDGVLLCTREGVLNCLLGKRTLPRENMQLRSILPHQIESGYYDTKHHKVWLGGFLNGVHVLTLETGNALTNDIQTGTAIPNPVRCITPYNDQTMLIGVDGLGVFQVNRLPNSSGEYESSLLFDANESSQGVLHGNGIYAIIRDLWGNIIIGSYSGGIDIARPVGSTPAMFQHIRDNQQSLLNDHVNCVAQFPDGMLVMGTDNGISLHNPITKQWRNVCRGAVVLSLCVTPSGTMLAATYGKGVFEINENGQLHQLYTKENGVLKDNHVYKLLFDKKNNLWMGCLDGALVEKNGSSTHYYPIKNVQDIIQLPNGKIAVGTANGIKVISPETGNTTELNYAINPDDVNKFILTLFVNDEKELWIGTDGGGVYVYNLDTRRSRQLTKANGLPSNTVNSITKDSNQRILIATDKGLAFVSQDEPATIYCVNHCYGIEREYSARAVVSLQNKHILYGTSSGALILNPDNIQKINYTAKLHIFGTDSKVLRLGYNERTFDLHYECINLRHQFDIVYQYKVGDGEWSQPTEQQYIRFTNLESGTHELYLRSVSRTCNATLDEQKLTIVIGQPWWNSWWMWIVYICLIGLAFYGAWKVYELHTKYMRLVINNPNINANTDKRWTHEDEEIEQQDSEGTEFIDEVTKIVASNLSDSEFNIDQLCREMAMSRTHFYLKLKSYTGKSPQDFIRVIRLERAAALLRGGHPVTETAILAGFDNPKYFSTVFKKYFGVSPSKYC